MPVERSFWIAHGERAEIREEDELPLQPSRVRIESIEGAISRGTERLVFSGAVPASEHERMRAPYQEGDFAFPVKYGYAVVGRVVEGPADRVGETVFCLHPHQDRFVVDAAHTAAVPADVPPHRAVLAANMETALNVVWDGLIMPGDRVAVVGGGLLGLLVAWLAAAIPGTNVTVVDTLAGRAETAGALGLVFASPDRAPEDCDVVVHASASEAGLATAIAAAGQEGRIVEMSWYGDRPVAMPLGGAFHSRRLSIVSSQVGSVPPGRRARWSNRRRLETALALLADPALDVLVREETAFDDLPGRYAAILGAARTLCHRIRYART